jgi:UDP-N-acetyl-D-galactosamine dehydrogenase
VVKDIFRWDPEYMIENSKIPRNVIVVGLGYVGLPLSLAFSNELPTTGFDIDVTRVEELLAGKDLNGEVPETELAMSDLVLTTDASCIADTEFIVVTVPTPVTADHKPDLSLIESASKLIGSELRGRSEGLPAPIVVYESTMYPGCTEEYCGSIIERESGLKSGEGFFLGYSPERTNFGDSEHTLETVIKVVAGQTPAVAKVVGDIYGRIAKAGVHMATNIKTAEASKVIENVQRDLNIALFNELAVIFDRMDLESSEVFDAAATKWNFHRYQPGLVGGHCIPVDPYYLTYAAEQAGYKADVVLAGRAANERMPGFIAEKLFSILKARAGAPASPSILILGQTFKADVVDFRNSKAISLARIVAAQGAQVFVFDPLISADEQEFANSGLIDDPFESDRTFDAVVVATPHRQFLDRPDDIVDLANEGGLIVDVTGSLDSQQIKESNRAYWAP